MKPCNLIDCHTHTSYSFDADDCVEKMIFRAIEIGLQAYAITDHCECNHWHDVNYYYPNPQDIPDNEDTYDFKSDFYGSVNAVTALKEKYSKKISLVCGCELGQADQDFKAADEVAANENLDFIIGSLHQLRGLDDFAFLDYSKMTENKIHKLLESYFNELYEICVWGKFDVLGHLTYPLRYIEGEYGINLDMKKHGDIIDEIFKKIISNGKGIEINTSGYRQKYAKPFPDKNYLLRYKELGGEILSLGSDSHCVKDLGKGIAEGAELAKSVGFEYVSYFRNHRPEFIKLK